jgi:hypothetical protein
MPCYHGSSLFLFLHIILLILFWNALWCLTSWTWDVTFVQMFLEWIRIQFEWFIISHISNTVVAHIYYEFNFTDIYLNPCSSVFVNIGHSIFLYWSYFRWVFKSWMGDTIVSHLNVFVDASSDRTISIFWAQQYFILVGETINICIRQNWMCIMTLIWMMKKGND